MTRIETPAVDAAADTTADAAIAAAEHPAASKPRLGQEIGGREGPDPTRYGDWELRGRCIDF